MFTEIKTMTDEELTELVKAIQAEKEARVQERKEILWNAIKDTIKNYTKEFGVIELYEGECAVYDIGYYDDFKIPGRITVNLG